MPEYPYQCKTCGHGEIEVKPMSKSEIRPKCPACKTKMDRVWELNFVLHGRGWPSREIKNFPNDPMI